MNTSNKFKSLCEERQRLMLKIKEITDALVDNGNKEASGNIVNDNIDGIISRIEELERNIRELNQFHEIVLARERGGSTISEGKKRTGEARASNIPKNQD